MSTRGTTTGLRDWAALVASLASVLSLSYFVGSSLGISKEFILAVLSALVGGAVGALSPFIAQNVRRLQKRPRAFLSYSHRSADFAADLAEALRRAGVVVWRDVERIKPGDFIPEKVDDAIRDADVMVVAITREMSPGVTWEFERASERGIRVLPVLLEDVDLPNSLASVRYIDARGKMQAAIAELVSAIEEGAG